MVLQRLEFTLTTKCNSQCIHCQAEASPSRNDVMEVKDAFDYLDEANVVSNIESFMEFGGEPMLSKTCNSNIQEGPSIADSEDRNDNKQNMGQKQGNC